MDLVRRVREYFGLEERTPDPVFYSAPRPTHDELVRYFVHMGIHGRPPLDAPSRQVTIERFPNTLSKTI